MHFTSSLIIGFAIAAFHLGSVASLGINCRGSFYCGLNGQIGQTNPLTSLSDTIVNGIDPNRHYNDGEQIACGHFPPQGDANSEPVQPLCVFCQYSSGASGSLIASLIPQLVDHGCTVCGSIPLGYPGDNNVYDGELTVNVVREDHVDCSLEANEGLCG